MSVISSEAETRSNRVFSRGPDGSAQSEPRAEAAAAETDRRLRGLINRAIRVIELQNARLRDHGLEPVSPDDLDDLDEGVTIDLTHAASG